MRGFRWRAFAVLLLVVVLVAMTGGATAILLFTTPTGGPPPTGDAVAAPPSASPLGPTAGADPGQPTAGAGPTAVASPLSPSVAPSPTARPPVKVPPPTSVPPEELTGYEWPLRNAWITSRFAPRDFGGFVVIDGKEVHDGLDLATRCGDKVRAAHDGTVLYAGRNFDVFLGYWGEAERIYARYEQQGSVNTLPIVVVVDDGNGYRSLYVHLSKAIAEAGNVVKAGEVIGLEGATGFATGCHLHYGLIRMDGTWQQVVPNLHRFGYPALVRERVNPIRIFDWADEFAPAALRRRVTPSASPSPTTGPPASQQPSPGQRPSPGQQPSPGTSPNPSGNGRPSPGPSGTFN